MMRKLSSTRSASLPEGWLPANGSERKTLHAELQKELPQGHLLYGRDVDKPKRFFT